MKASKLSMTGRSLPLRVFVSLCEENKNEFFVLFEYQYDSQ